MRSIGRISSRFAVHPLFGLIALVVFMVASAPKLSLLRGERLFRTLQRYLSSKSPVDNPILRFI